MFRFDGYDGRLTRVCEVTLGLCEAARSSEGSWDLSVHAHSGETPWLTLVPDARGLTGEKDMLTLMRTICAHAQHCLSGDNSLPAYREAIREAQRPMQPPAAQGVADWMPDVDNWQGAGGALGQAHADPAEDGDSAEKAETSSDALVLFVTDANLRRYGIPAQALGRICEDGWRAGVKNYALLIGQEGRDAQAVRAACPEGKAVVLGDASMMPDVFRHILSDLRSDTSK
jgi:hypothetical protein